ncbi:Superfamily II DNA and RNA helicase [Streptomyces sp. DconLS]|nr:Superfamily II DNA and RNA helicase [Streptomyces sp. DconLS]
MSVSSFDQIVVPENENVNELVDEATEATETQAPEAPQTPQITFADLGLPEGVVRKLAQNGVTSPFPIQAATIPDALLGKDILGRGRTGSGKTLSFGLPTLAQLAGGRTEKKRPRAVILTPTRELAMQVADALQPYGDVVGLKMKVVCGGTSMGNQIYALERGVDILVATPGRLRDIINRGACSLEDVQITVLDEADQMSDLGFLPEVTELLDQVPADGQRMLFSATMENEIQTLVDRYLKNPVSHEVDAAQGAVTTMSHHILIVKPKDKAPVTAAIASRKGRTIIFVRTQLGADRVAEQLRDAGVKADALHGGMTQGARTRTLADFKDGYVNVLVATDVAARGIHVDGIDLVLNVDPAGDHKDYLHRAGRTARAGRTGTVVSLSLPHQRRQIFRLMEDAGVDAGRHIIQGGAAFEPEVAEITGARSMTEVQAESAGNAAQQAEREVGQLTKQLERAQRRATELREEADRLVARVARERGEDPETAVAEAQASAAEELAAEAPAARETEREERPAASAAPERRDDRRPFDRDRRDDRGGRGFERRDDRGGRSFERRDDRGGFRVTTAVTVVTTVVAVPSSAVTTVVRSTVTAATTVAAAPSSAVTTAATTVVAVPSSAVTTVAASAGTTAASAVTTVVAVPSSAATTAVATVAASAVTTAVATGAATVRSTATAATTVRASAPAATSAPTAVVTTTAAPAAPAPPSAAATTSRAGSATADGSP